MFLLLYRLFLHKIKYQCRINLLFIRGKSYEKHLCYEKLIKNYLRILTLRHYANKLNCQALLIEIT